MSLPAMLAMMTGGNGAGLPPLAELVKIPCARCVAERADDAEVMSAQTLAAGSLVCLEHARRELGELSSRLVACANKDAHPSHSHSVVTDGRRYVATCLGNDDDADPFGTGE